MHCINIKKHKYKKVGRIRNLFAQHTYSTKGVLNLSLDQTSMVRVFLNRRIECSIVCDLSVCIIDIPV
jgi:hypothetical protein